MRYTANREPPAIDCCHHRSDRRHLRRADARDAPGRGHRNSPRHQPMGTPHAAPRDGLHRRQVQRLATVTYLANDQGAAISSGSFLTMGMAIVPCSMRTLAAVAHGLGDNLIHRAADVVLKERRRLLLAPREAPLSEIHLDNMLKLSRMGVVICPPMPGFYQRPESIDDLVNHSVVRMLDQFGIHVDGPGRWGEEFALGVPGKVTPEDSENY